MTTATTTWIRPVGGLRRCLCGGFVGGGGLWESLWWRGFVVEGVCGGCYVDVFEGFL